MQYQFRIHQAKIRYEDLVSTLDQLGTDLFLVLHEKTDRIHYHGLLKLNVSEKTFRRRMNELLHEPDHSRGGLRPIFIKKFIPKKDNDEDALMSYFAFRPGHPNKIIKKYFDDEKLKALKDIAEEKIDDHEGGHEQLDDDGKKKKQKETSVSQKDLNALLPDCSVYESLRSIHSRVINHYKQQKRIINIALKNQLVWTLYTYTHGDEYMYQKMLQEDQTLMVIDQGGPVEKESPYDISAYSLKCPNTFECKASWELASAASV